MTRACLLCLLASVLPTLLLAETPNFDLLDRSIVKVRTHRDHPTEKEDEDESGTGFVISLAGGVVRMLTAAHVVVDATKVTVAFNSDKVTPVPVRVLPRVSENLDLAVLEFRVAPGLPIPKGLAPFEWVPRDGIQVSQHVWTIDGDWDPAPNTIIRLDHTANPELFEYTQVSVGQGYSGAPVFNDAGLLLGVHLREASRADYKLSVAVKIDAALETLDALGYSRGSLNALAEAVRKPSPGVPETRPNTPARAAQEKPVLWRDLNNNQLYQIRIDSGHMYISQTNGAVVADLVLANRKGVNGYYGNSSLSTCPGSGFMEITQVTDTRISGRIEQKPAAANVHCGGVFGMLRNLSAIAFIREQ